MPAIQASQLAQMAKMNFKANAIVLPERFQGFTSQAPFDASDQKAPDASALFGSASTLRYHVDTARTIGQGFEALIDACADTIARGHAQWQAAAKFVGVLINGPVGMIVPGTLIGPPSMSGPMLAASANVAGRQPMFLQYVQSIAGAIGTAFLVWQSGYMGTLMYPSGAACSITMAPAPNLPMPLAAGASPAGDAMMTPGTLAGLMLGMHGAPGNHAQPLFMAFAQAFSVAFTQWKTTTQILNVTGVGGFAPPPPAPPGPVAMAIGAGGVLQ